jgi:type VI protein secretion system component VasK
MSLAYRQFKVYLRIALVVIVLVLAGWILFKNRHHTVKIWFFGLTDPEKEVNVVWVMLWTVAITRTVWWVFSFSYGLMRDWREIKRQQAEADAKRQHERRVAELDERERKLNETMKRAESAEDGSPVGSATEAKEKGGEQ